MIEDNRDVIQTLNPTATRNENWHVWPVTIPRRSITGRLVWGTVFRRWDGRRWVYKRYIESSEHRPSRSGA